MLLRLLSCLAILVLLAACAGRQGEQPLRLAAALEEAGTPEAAVTVRVENLRPGMQVEEIRLTGPQDRRIAALPESYRTLRGERVVRQRPTVGIGAYGGSKDGIRPSFSLSLPLLDWSWARREDHAPRAVLARIPLPEDYREEPEAWRVEADVTDVAGATLTRSISAPE